MSQTTPRDLMYSQAVKPVSIASTAQTRKFLPITSGTYTPTSNNIIRIPINANAFVDLKNAMLKYTITNKTAVAAQLDGSAGSIISRLNVLGPDGAPLETIDSYNKLYQALSQLERSRDNFAGICNALEGSSALAQTRYAIVGTSTTAFEVYIDGALVGSFNTATNDDVIVFGNYRLVNAADHLTAYLYYRGVRGQQITWAGGATGSSTGGGSLQIDVALIAEVPTRAIFVNGQKLAAGSRAEWVDSDYTMRTQSDCLVATTGARTYSHNFLSCLTKLDVLYPAFAVGGGGLVIEITLAASQEVLNVCKTIGTAPSYEVSAVELIAPVIQYPENVVQSFKQMVQAQGSVSMSSVSFQNFIFPLTAPASTVSIPLAMRSRSLKALYFFFQPNSSSTDYSYSRSAARESPVRMNFQLRIGSQYYPASQVQYQLPYGQDAVTAQTGNITEVVIELEKSVSKLADIRHGSVLNAETFGLPQVLGGTSIFGLDLEASATSFLENGVNTADNSLTMYLELTNMLWRTANVPTNAIAAPTLDATNGNVYVFAMFDNTLSILPNGNIIQTH